ncbi:MAG: hypothetical protein J6R72_02615 [Candidatus Methanomethylophilaceae archaeon]|nr:hypothetical protein [Candidatus Methanomethylophilaceae archaeon]
MDSIDSEITRVVNLIFVLDSTENISDDDYAKACKFLNECKDTMIIDGMETEVRVYVASTSGEITDAVLLPDFKWESAERPAQDPASMMLQIPDLLTKVQRLGSNYIADNVLIYISNGKFLEQYPRAYIDVTRNWRYGCTPKLIVCFDEGADKRALADIVGTPGRVFGADIFDDIKFYVIKGGVEFHKIHEVAEIPTVYAEPEDPDNYKVDRRAEEHEVPQEDVYDM